MLEKKDSASSGVLLLCGDSSGGSRSLDDESHPVKLNEGSDAVPSHPDDPLWCLTNQSDTDQSPNTESDDDDEPDLRTQTKESTLDKCQNTTGTGSAGRSDIVQIPLVVKPCDDNPVNEDARSWTDPISQLSPHRAIPSGIEITFFDERGDKCCINSDSLLQPPANREDEDSGETDNLLLQDSGSQFLFPMDMALTGSEMERVPSTCSTVPMDEDESFAVEVSEEPVQGALVIGSAPAAPISVSRGILQHSAVARMNRKNSQVSFREHGEDEAPCTPLLSAQQPGESGPISPCPVVSVPEKAVDDDEWQLEPPDGGWGWLVLAGSVLVNLLVPGTVKSFGVLFVEFLEVFRATPMAAAWIPALCYFLYSSLGPVASMLSARFSYRTVTVLGGAFAAAGMMLSFFASSITYLYISFGILVGTGAGLAFPPGVFIVSSYFVRRRGLANGLCISGSAIGSIILPPLLRHLLNVYGYRGAVLIMGAIMCNVWVGAMFYHPVERHMRRVRKSSKRDPDEQYSASAEGQSTSAPVEIITPHSPNSTQLAVSQPISIPACGDHQQQDTTQKLLWYFEGSPDPPDTDLEKCWLTAQSASFIGPNIDKASVDNSPSPLAIRDALENTQQTNVITNSLMHNQEEKKITDWDFFSTLPHSKQRILRLSMRPSQSKAVAAALHQNSSAPAQPNPGGMNRNFSSNVSLSSFRYISTVHHGSTLVALQQHPPDNEFASNLSLRSVSQSCWESVLDCARCLRCRSCTASPNKNQSKKSDSKNGSNNNNNNNDNTAEKTRKRQKKLLDLSLLKDSLYLVILLSNSTNAIGYTNFIILLPAYAISLGFDKSSASLLLSLVAAFDLVGRIGGSALSDLNFMPRKYYYIGGLALSGATLAVIPAIASTGYTALSVACAVFGLGSGTYVGITAVLMADMLGAERLGDSFGMSLFLNGVLQLLGPPICGLALQQLRSYTPIFSMLGIVLLVGAAMWGLIPIIERRRRQETDAAGDQNV